MSKSIPEPKKENPHEPLPGVEVPYVHQPSIAASYFDKHGRELPSPMQIQPPAGYRRQPSLAEQIREMVRSERLAADLAAQGAETFEEADDFDVDDDYDPTTPYEEVFEGDVIKDAEEIAAKFAPKKETTIKEGGDSPPQTTTGNSSAE